MTHSQTRNQIPHNIVLIPLQIPQLPASHHSRIHLLLDIPHGPLTLLIILLDDQSQQLLLIGLEAAHLINRQLLEDHVVLGEGARLVGQDVLDAAQLFGDLAVAGDCARDLLVVVDFVGEDDLGEVQVHAQGNGDDRRQKQNLTEEVQKPVLAEASGDYYYDG